MRVVIDTNVLVSALLNRQGTPGKLMDAVSDGSLVLVLTTEILEELAGTLQQPKIRSRVEKTNVDVGLYLDLLRLYCETVAIDNIDAPLPRDKKDQHVLAALIASKADWLITGDADLLVLAETFPVISPTYFRSRFLD
jgi:putative PIN family toxin of toxin-antitoxin system